MLALSKKTKLALLAGVLALLAVNAAGQLPMGAPDPLPPDDEGKEVWGYKVTQSIDLGGRITSVSGSEAMYDTLVNAQSGPRILDQSLTMMSLSHQDIFDSLTLNSFGWGGDPQQALRVRIAKYRWYSITGSYQYMQNYFNYDLLANPLNPSNISPNLPVLNSPHAYYNRQKLYNFGVVLFPTHRFTVRIDYNRNSFTGPSFSTDHQGTEALTYQNTDNILNGFRAGVDAHVTKNTTLSYTQMVQWYNGQTGYGLAPYNSFPLSNGIPVSLGLPWGNGSPCNNPLTNGVVNPTCNGFLAYGQTQDIQTTIPTEQINLKSTSIKNLDFNAQYQYSGAHMTTPVDETFSGLISRSGLLGFNSAGSNSAAHWVSSSADASAVYHISDKLRLVDTFRWRNWRSYGDYLNLQDNFYGAASGGSGTLLTPIATFPATVLSHSSGSPADVINEYWVNLDGEETKQNDFEVQYDVSKNFGVRTGFQWIGDNIQPGTSYQAALGDIYYPNNANRGDCVGVPLNPDGSCTFAGVLAPYGNPTVPINNYSWLVGAWYSKGALHAHADASFGSANNYAYRIDPRTGQNISGSVNYTPKTWLSIGTDMMFQRATNYSDAGQINFNFHNYHVAFNGTVTPNKLFSVDVIYSFDAIQQNIIECFPGTYPLNSTQCFDGSGFLQTNGFYATHTQFGSFAVTTRPIKRLGVRVGYSIVNNDGNTTQFNLLQPLGPLASRYQMPLAGFDYNVYHNVTFRAGWTYQNYNENSFVGPTAPRNFHANETTLAVHYAF